MAHHGTGRIVVARSKEVYSPRHLSISERSFVQPSMIGMTDGSLLTHRRFASWRLPTRNLVRNDQLVANGARQTRKARVICAVDPGALVAWQMA